MSGIGPDNYEDAFEKYKAAQNQQLEQYKQNMLQRFEKYEEEQEQHWQDAKQYQLRQYEQHVASLHDQANAGETEYVNERLNQTLHKCSLFSYNHNDEKVDISDISFSENIPTKIKNGIIYFLDYASRANLSWYEVADSFNKLVDTINNYDNRVSGPFVDVKSKDGTVYKIDINGQTISKYASDHKTIVEQRPMTEDEKSLSTEELINKLKNNNQSLEKQPPVNESDGADKVPQKQEYRKVVDDYSCGVLYAITDKENGGYELLMKGAVNPWHNKAVLAFQKGSGINTTDYSQIKEEGKYFSFRGLKGETWNLLQQKILNVGQNIGMQTEIYNDLQNRQANGEKLTEGEKKFMSDYLESLRTYGLQMNSDGELEDIPTKRKRRGKIRS